MTRARLLCEPLGDTPQLFWVLYRLMILYRARAEHQMARECAEQALTLAQRLQDPALFPSAHNGLGLTLLTLGDLTAARGHFEQGMAHYDARRGDFVWGHTVQVLSNLARTLWLLGYPDQAVQRNHEALSLVQERPTPSSNYLARYEASTLHQLRREVHAVHEQTEAALAIVSEEGTARYLPRLLHRRGWVLAAQGQYEEGIAQMSQALTTIRAVGDEGGEDPSALAQLAEAYGQSGHVEEGLSLLAEARAAVEQTGARLWEAEVQRLTGELLLLAGRPGRGAGGSLFPAGPWTSPAVSRPNPWSCEPRRVAHACGNVRASAPRRGNCWRRSMAGSRRDLTRLTSRRRRHSWRHSRNIVRVTPGDCHKVLVGFQGCGCVDSVQPDFCHALLLEALICQ